MQNEPIEMTLREINVAVALERGWKWYRSGRCVDFVHPSRIEHLLSAGWHETDPPEVEIQDQVSVPAYTTSIADAWPLLEEMQGAGESNRKNDCLKAVFGISDKDSTNTILSYIRCKLSPLTITQAYLEWKTGTRVTVRDRGE